MLDALSADETDALLEGLGGGDPRVRPASPRRRGRGGQPALPRAAPRACAGRRARPSARSRDDPGAARCAPRPARPRRAAVLERGAVVGKEFTRGRRRGAPRSRRRADRRHAPRDARRTRLRTAAEATARSAFATSSCRTRSTARRRSACARSSTSASPTGSTQTSPDLPELDEFVGYHLEQAYRLRDRARRVGSARRAAGRGRRASARRGGPPRAERGDMPATASLLGRAVSLLPRGDERRYELMCELGIAQQRWGRRWCNATFLDALVSRRGRRASSGCAARADGGRLRAAPCRTRGCGARSTDGRGKCGPDIRGAR